MKFSDLNKEQKQYVILGIMGAVTVFFVLQNLFLAPMRERKSQAEKMIGEIEPKVRRGEAILRRDRMNREEIDAMSSEILEIYRTQLPDRESQLSWAQRVLNTIIKDQLNLEGEAERVHPAQRVSAPRGTYAENKDNLSMWSIFAVDVNLNAGFDDVRRFLQVLHESHPYASVGRLTLSANPANPAKHRVEMVIEWPVFRYQQDLALITTNAEDSP